jgi:hypothetical protein
LRALRAYHECAERCKSFQKNRREVPSAAHGTTGSRRVMAKRGRLDATVSVRSGTPRGRILLADISNDVVGSWLPGSRAAFTDVLASGGIRAYGNNPSTHRRRDRYSLTGNIGSHLRRYECGCREAISQRTPSVCGRKQAEDAGGVRLLRGERDEELGVASVDMCFGIGAGH